MATGLDRRYVPPPATTGAGGTGRPERTGLPDLSRLLDKLRERPERRMRFMGMDGVLVERSFGEVHADVTAVTAELRAGGLGPGDLVGVMGVNSYEWVLADLALLGLGCVSVALPAEQRGERADLAALVERYRLRALLLTRPPQTRTPVPAEVAVLFQRPLSFRSRDVGTAGPAVPAEAFTIAFSSGTAGTRKGLVLSRAGVANTIATSGRAWEITGDDNILIVMPFSNFQQRYLMYTAIWFGAEATVVAPERMFQKLKSFAPTIILGPPSFYEIVHNRVRAAKPRERMRHRMAAALYAVAPRRLTRPLRARLGAVWTGMYGPRVRLMLTGSAPVPARVVKLFQQLGAPLFEVYGSTEVGWIALNTPKAFRVGTAGRPADGVDVWLAPDGEVLVRSPYPQALGYLFDGEETQASVFLDDGTIATADVGAFDRAGFLRLTGRKKNIIVTRSGVKISAEELERDVADGCRVSTAMVFATEPTGLLTCVVWLDDWQSARRRAEVEANVDNLNRTREPALRITRVVFRPDTELTVDSGLLTRNLKLDRTAAMRAVLAEEDRKQQ
jgi:long-chain acyl-CoA synthetase